MNYHSVDVVDVVNIVDVVNVVNVVNIVDVVNIVNVVNVMNHYEYDYGCDYHYDYYRIDYSSHFHYVDPNGCFIPYQILSQISSFHSSLFRCTFLFSPLFSIPSCSHAIRWIHSH